MPGRVSAIERGAAHNARQCVLEPRATAAQMRTRAAAATAYCSMWQPREQAAGGARRRRLSWQAGPRAPSPPCSRGLHVVFSRQADWQGHVDCDKGTHVNGLQCGEGRGVLQAAAAQAAAARARCSERRGVGREGGSHRRPGAVCNHRLGQRRAGGWARARVQTRRSILKCVCFCHRVGGRPQHQRNMGWETGSEHAGVPAGVSSRPRWLSLSVSRSL